MTVPLSKHVLKKLAVCIGCIAFAMAISPISFAGSDSAAHEDWPSYLGNPERNHYSTLHQITRENVAGLEQAWIYHGGGENQIQCNPIVVDGILYGVSAQRHIFALDAATGKEVWTFVDPDEQGSSSVLRGVQYWKSGKDKRLMVAIEHHLYALNAKTGKLVESFGDHGGVDIKNFYDRDVKKLAVGATSPGVIYKNTMILSVRVSEGEPAAPGDIMAFDVPTGKLKWVFHTIPRPGEFGYDTWPPDAWKQAGGANCWAGMALDEKRGIVYIPTGSAAYDFYGADRKGANLFANCLLAINAETGERIWHFQIVHHDLWDRDPPAPPNLLTIEQNGKKRDIVAQTTKSGYIFVFDRVTGEPIFPIEEKPAPPSDIPGEEAWPTQPLPLKPPPFARQTFAESDVTDRSPKAHDFVLERLKRLRHESPFVPPTLEGTLIFPGFDGGAEWGGSGVNPKTGVMFVNASEMPYTVNMVDATANAGGSKESVGKMIYSQNCIYCHGADLKGDPIKVFPPLQGLQKKYSLQQMQDIVRLGRDRMPSFEFLKPAELESVVKYICDIEETNTRGNAASDTSIAEPKAGQRWFNHTGYNRFLDQDGFPGIKPPWGTLTAVDLNKGDVLWKVPLGETADPSGTGVLPTGTENYGGPVVTASGLIFIAATKDAHLRALDEQTGKELWRAALPAAGYATPSTYQVKGRQYVVIAAGGGKLGTPAGDAYVAYALPNKKKHKTASVK